MLTTAANEEHEISGLGQQGRNSGTSSAFKHANFNPKSN